jgi:hypothetical protein
MHILPGRPIRDVQKEFNQEFPYLKLEFYQNKVYQRNNSWPKKIVPSNCRIGDAQEIQKDGYIKITPEMKVSELEKILNDQFSLSAHVFRCSGKFWLQTSMTDNWTLAQQNLHGQEISGHGDNRVASG